MKIPLEKLKDYNAFEIPIWNKCKNNLITRKQVQEAIRKKNFCNYPPGPDATRSEHARRVALLVVCLDLTPIELDIGVPELGCENSYWVQDGHHRLAAAFFRGDQFIEANISGSCNYAHELFGDSDILS